jgi:hypothetical protein
MPAMVPTLPAAAPAATSAALAATSESAAPTSAALAATQSRTSAAPAMQDSEGLRLRMQATLAEEEFGPAEALGSRSGPGL